MRLETSTIFAIALFTALFTACSGPPGAQSSSTAASGLNGVPVDGYPSYAERLALVAINRARSAPNDVMLRNAAACSAPKNPTKPLMLSVEGSRAARFHSRMSILEGTGLSHDSYCTLRPDIGMTGCDGAASCGCMAGTECISCTTLGGCGTNAFTRASYFGFGANGEVGAAGYQDSFAAVEGWVTECPPADGHRQILTGEGIDVIGLGVAAGPSMCWSSFYFGDTGFQGLQTAVLPAGVHAPENGASVEFWVNYFSASAAMSVDVVVDGVCRPMAVEGGSGGNATYKTNLNIGPGCHEYWFLARDGSGTAHTYPEVGAWGAGDCSEYSATRMETACGGPSTCTMGQMRSCGRGRCAGMQTCDANGQWGACNGPAPLEREACNGIDDDCDGAVPDDERDGDGDMTRGCAGDCNDTDPAVHPGAAETCNEADDDCDATDDEGCACMTEAEVRSCGSNIGACMLGMQTCTALVWSECSGAIPPSEEICGNDVDEDCDGIKNDGCAGNDAGLDIDVGPEPAEDAGEEPDAPAEVDARDPGPTPRGGVQAGCGCATAGHRVNSANRLFVLFVLAAMMGLRKRVRSR